MTESPRGLPHQWEENDVSQVVLALHRSGPLRLQDLPGEPGLAHWTAARLEEAVVAAWSRDLIFVDSRDRLVPMVAQPTTHGSRRTGHRPPGGS